MYFWAALASVVFAVNLWKRKGRTDLVDCLALSLLAWMAISLSWSLDWRQGLFQLINAAALCAVFMWVRRHPQYIGLAAIIALAASLVLQFFNPEDWGGHGNRNFQTEALILLMALGLHERGPFGRLCLLALSIATLWYLIASNPSKIEFVVMVALVGWYGINRIRSRAA